MKHTIGLVLLVLLMSFGCKESVETPASEEQVATEEVRMPHPGDMVLVPAGEFVMGSDKLPPSGPALAAPEHKVNLPAYYIDVYEVTFGEWIKFTTESDFSTESNWRQFYTIGKEDYPVTNVTVDDAAAYAKWAGKRLPTEAEWEKAARGTEGFAYPWGNTWDPTKPNCAEFGKRDTARVGEMHLDKSPYGCYDMMGNVQEWTADLLKPYPKSPVAKDVLFTRGYVAVRGASYALWPSKGGGMFLWSRSAFFPKSQYGIGFRCAKDATEAKPAAFNPQFRQMAEWFPGLREVQLD